MERRPLLKHPCDGLFFSTSVANEIENLNIWSKQTKKMGENIITNIMKVSLAVTSVKESEKKVYESLCEKNNSQEAEESRSRKFRAYHQCHRHFC